MKLIISNDDFGLSFGFNKAIEDCFKKSITTSTSIITNGFAFQDSLKLLKTSLKNISLGLHLNITHGEAFSEELATPEGRYKFEFFDYYIRLIKYNPGLLKAIGKDLESQFKISIEKHNLPIDHVDGHDHIHMIPSVFEIVCKLCKKYNINYLRLTNEPYYLTSSFSQSLTPLTNKNIIKFILLNYLSQKNLKLLKQYKLISPQFFYGLLHSNNINSVTFKGAIKNAVQQNASLIEIALHPAFLNHPKDINYPDKTVKLFATSPQREIETSLLTNSKIKQFIKDNKIALVGFNDFL